MGEVQQVNHLREPTRQPVWEVLLPCFAAFALYVFEAQRSFYLHDGLQIVYTHLAQGNLSHPRHPLYLPLAAAFVQAFECTGVTIHMRAVWFSGLCTAGAVLVIGSLGWRLGLSRPRRMLLATVFALSPIVFFFATVVEFHALFLFFAALAFWWAERMHRVAEKGSLRRRLLHAALLGAITWTSAMAHSTGNLLLAPISAVWLVRAPLRRRWPEIAGMAAMHVILLLVVTPQLHAALGRAELPGRPGEWLEEWFHPDGAARRFASVLLFELALPLLPATLAVFAVRRSDWRRAGWVLLALLPYALLCTLILVDDAGRPIRERGAYFFPWVIPGLALLAARVPLPSRRRRWAWLLLWVSILGLGIAGNHALVRAHDQRPGEAFGEAVREMTQGQRAWVFCAGRADLEAVLLENSEVRPLLVTSLVTQPTEQMLAGLPGLETAIDGQLADGWRVLVSEAVFRDVPGTPPEVQERLGMLRHWLATHFDLEMRVATPFRFRELRPR